VSYITLRIILLANFDGCGESAGIMKRLEELRVKNIYIRGN
jgi:hypothetical protein